jgi:hypothetical protein
MQTDQTGILARNRKRIIGGAVLAVLGLALVNQVYGNRSVDQVEEPADVVEVVQPNWTYTTSHDAMRETSERYAVTESVVPLRTTYGVSKMWLHVPSGGDAVLLVAETGLRCGRWTALQMKIDNGDVEYGSCMQTSNMAANEAWLISITLGNDVDRGPLLPRLLTAERLIVELPSSLGGQQVEFNVSGLILP